MVEIPLSAALTGTSVKDFWMVSNQVVDMIAFREKNQTIDKQQAEKNKRL